ncbi:MAG: hypothetical protein ACJARZ_002439 [Dokdonia sp.]|jgi:hypothetical protein
MTKRASGPVFRLQQLIPMLLRGAGIYHSGLVFLRGYTDGIPHKLNLQLHYHAERGSGGTRSIETRGNAAHHAGAHAPAWGRVLPSRALYSCVGTPMEYRTRSTSGYVTTQSVGTRGEVRKRRSPR